MPTIIDRISSYGELASIEESEFRFFITRPIIDIEKVVWKDSTKKEARTHLLAVKEILLEADFSSPETIKEAIMPYAEQNGKGVVLWPLRYALSRQEKSVDPFTICYVLRLDEVVARIDIVCHAIDS